MNDLLLKTPITKARAIELLEEQVALKGADYVYPRVERGESCVNVEQDFNGNWVPSCIVGYAVCAAGADPIDFVDLGLVEAAAGSLPVYAYDEKESVIEEGEAYDRTPALAIFDIAQSLQDFGSTWGAAVEAAKFVAGGGSFDEALTKYRP